MVTGAGSDGYGELLPMRAPCWATKGTLNVQTEVLSDSREEAKGGKRPWC